MNAKVKLLIEELGLKNPPAANCMEWKNMVPKNDNEVREEEGRERAISQLYGSKSSTGWITGFVVAALVLIGAVFLTSERGRNSQTTTTDGRNVEAPATANSGSAR